jgi:hypothetical protein
MMLQKIRIIKLSIVKLMIDIKSLIGLFLEIDQFFILEVDGLLNKEKFWKIMLVWLASFNGVNVICEIY